MESFPSGCKISAVLPAGGNGERFGCNTPKQFNVVLQQPVIVHTLSAFHRIPFLDQIVVVVNEEYVPYLRDLSQNLDFDKVIVVPGAQTRHRSIYEGLKALVSDNRRPDVVIIHDAARIFAEETLVREVALAANLHGASGVVRPLVSTVISEDPDHFLDKSLDRQLYCGSEMPQGFQFDIIYQAYHKATDYDFDFGTECLLLAQKYTGTRAKLIPGPEYLWKITYKKDLYAAEGILKEKHLLMDVRFEDDIGNKDLLLKSLVESCGRKNIQTQELMGTNVSILEHVNSVVCIYSEWSPQKLSDRISAVSTKKDKSPGIHLQTCVVQLYSGQELSSQAREDFMDYCAESATKYQDLIVYGVVNQKSTDFTTVSKMVASLLWNREKTLSGQCFIIR